MDLLALDNLNTLTNIDEDTLFMFDDKTIIINDDDSNYKIRSSASLASLTLLELNFEYGFYFTFHQSFTILENNINRNVFITDLNNALNTYPQCFWACGNNTYGILTNAHFRHRRIKMSLDLM